MIHVCYGLYDKDGRYSKFTGISICSIFENTTADVTIHILHDNTLSEENRDKFVWLVGRYGRQIKFYNVEKLCAEKIAEFKKLFPSIETARFTIGTMYRLVIIDLFDTEMEKVIYLDSDILVNLDISELWNTNLRNKPLAAVAESQADSVGFPLVSKQHYLINSNLVTYENYFNAAVMVLNLDYLREQKEKINSAMRFIAENTECFCFDQDIMNYCFTNEYLHLDPKFDQFVARTLERVDKKISQRKVIYHYTGSDPTFDFSDSLNKLYFKYFVKTPWFDLKMLENISDGVKQIYNDGKSFALRISKIVSGKRKIFFTTPANEEAVRQIFSVTADEEIILSDKADMQIVLREKLNDGDKILFVIVANYQSVKKFLIQLGFTEYKDFINGTEFLTTEQGGIFNSYSLVKIM